MYIKVLSVLELFKGAVTVVIIARECVGELCVGTSWKKGETRLGKSRGSLRLLEPNNPTRRTNLCTLVSSEEESLNERCQGFYQKYLGHEERVVLHAFDFSSLS